MSALLATLVLFAAIIIYIYYRVRSSMSRLHEQSWKIILTQRVPDWFDRRTLPFLKNKFEQRHERAKSSLNLLYSYVSENGRLGDARWGHVEKLCAQAVRNIPQSEKEAGPYDVCVGITSGGAFIAPYISKLLGIKRCEFVTIRKYSCLGVRKRIQTWLWSGGKKQRRRRKIKLDSVKGSDLHDIKGKRILLCDDQLATGETLDTATDFLTRTCGARSVHRICLTSLPPSYPNCTIGTANLLLLWPWGLDS